MSVSGRDLSIYLYYIFQFFFKGPHYYWLGSLRWLVVLDKYTKFLDDRNTDGSSASSGFLDKLGPAGRRTNSYAIIDCRLIYSSIFWKNLFRFFKLEPYIYKILELEI